MSATVASIAARVLPLFSPGLSSEIFVVGVALFVASLVALGAAFATFAVIAISAGRRTRFTPVTTSIGGRQVTFNEVAFLPLVAALGTITIQAFQQFFGNVSGAVGSVVQLVVNNPRRIFTTVLISGFVALYLFKYELQYPIRTQAYNCFIGPLVQPIALPGSATFSYLASTSLPLSNFVSRLWKTGTTSVVVRALVGSSEAVVRFFMLLGATALKFSAAQTAWLTLQVPPDAPPNQVAQQMLVAPDFDQTAKSLSQAIASLTLIGDATCAPLTPYVWDPLIQPITSRNFFSFVNNTLALPYVFFWQGLLRPPAQYLKNLGAGGGTFASRVSEPSFNSTFDTFNAATRGLFRVLDGFVPELIDSANTLLRDVTGLPLPTVPFPRRGLWTATFGALTDLSTRTAKLTFNLVFKLIFDPDLAYSYPEGVRIWKVDEILDGVREYTTILTDLPRFVADYLEAIGLEFQSTLTTPLLTLGVEPLVVQQRAVTSDESQTVTLTTVGDVINNAFVFVAGIVSRVPCVIDAIVNFLCDAIAFTVELAVGTVYAFVSLAFAGRVPSPLAHAQSLWKGATVYDARCVVGGRTLFTIPKLLPCPDYYIALESCRPPDFVVNFPISRYEVTRQILPSWTLASDSVVQQIGFACSSVTCTTELRTAAGEVTPPPPDAHNRFFVLFVKAAEPIVCLYDLLARLCVGSVCPIRSVTARNIVEDVVNLVLLPLNVVVHLDRLDTPYFVSSTCFPLHHAPRDLADIFHQLTNSLRSVINAMLTPLPALACPLVPRFGVVADGQFIVCCALNFADGVVGFVDDIATTIILQSMELIRNLLPASVGGVGAPGYQPPPLAISEAWLTVMAKAGGCAAAAPIPRTLICKYSTPDAVFPEGPGKTPSLQARVRMDFGEILNQLLLVVPRTIVAIVNGTLNLIFTPTTAGVSALINAAVRPLLLAFGTILQSLHAFIDCIADNNEGISLAFGAIGTFIVQRINQFVGLALNVAVAAIQLVFGIFQMITGGGIALIQAGFATFLQIIFGFIIAIFGQSSLCPACGTLCFLGVRFEPLITACRLGYGTTDGVGYDFSDSTCGDGRKRSLDFERDCFDIVAEYGFDAAARLDESPTPARGVNESIVACYRKVISPSSVFAAITEERQMRKATFAFLGTFGERVAEHWRTTGEYVAREASALKTQQLAALSAASTAVAPVEPAPSIDFGLFARALTDQLAGHDDSLAIRAFRAAHAPRKRGIDTIVPQHDLWLVNLAAAVMHARDIGVPSIGLPNRAPAELAAHQPAEDDQTQKALGLGVSLIAEQTALGVSRASSRLADRVRHLLGYAPTPASKRAEPRRPVVSRPANVSAALLAAQRLDAALTTGAPLLANVSANVLPVLGLPACSLAEQIVCTDCAYVDDLILVTEKSFHSARRFYTGAGRGTLAALTDQLSTTLNDVLALPAGTDTYATEHRRRPFITDRLWNIRWAWQWNYTEFIDTVGESVACDLADPLEALPFDPDFKAAFRSLFGPLIPLAQSAICRAFVAPAETATRIVEKYWTCDYDSTLYCETGGTDSPDGAQRLLDGFANSLLIVVLLGLVIELVPGGSVLYMVIGPLVLIYGTLWIGYGASPACTAPGLMMPFGAYPVCAPMDAYRLLEETLAPQPFPIALIDPIWLAANGDRLVTECGVVPQVIDCSGYGFEGLYDNIFYTTGVLLGGEFNAAAASALAGVSADAAASAARFTPQFIDDLEDRHNAGDVCNRETLGYAIFGLLALAVSFLGSIAALVFLVPFIVAVVLFTAVTLLIANEVSSQTDQHYVEDARVRDDVPK